MVAFIGSAGGNQCVNLYVDFGQLDNNNKITKCIPANSNVLAPDILTGGKIAIEGTAKYGLQVVCRVNGLPSKEIESCSVMPSEKAYWAIIVRKKASLVDPMPKWGWAQTGVSEIKLNPGESLGLVFTENGKVRWPD